MGAPAWTQVGTAVLVLTMLHVLRWCSLLTINASRWVVLDAQINVLIDTKSKVACVTEVAPEELILLNLETTFL